MRSKLLLFAAGILALNIIFLLPAVSATCPINSSTNIVIYGQTGSGGVGTLSKSWINQFFSWWKSQDPSINYLVLTSTNIKTDCNLSNYPNLKLYVQPGGNAYDQQRTLGSAGKNNILGFIDGGKAYLGICAGWYYASNDYYWQGSYYNWANLLKRFPTVEGSITDIANYDVSPGYALTTVSNGLNMIYWGGPTRGWRQTPSSVPGVKLLGFSAIPGNLSAAVKNGKMLLLSTHPEAYENDGIVGLSTEQRIENYKWLANAINDVAGTNFYVPPYKQCIDGIDNDGDGFIDYSSDPGCSSALDDNESDNPQCSDGIDNDGDNLVDYPNDSDCTSLRDNSEYYVSGPIELLNESFESGSLTEWTLITASGANPWTIATTNPYQGTYYAEAMPQSTTEPASVMEKTISTSGYENIRFNYYRRLIGLDPADEFKAKWYDGSTWYVLEETASNSANDANYVFKNFSLPSSANNNPNFKIRFECTAGAVSEFCRVDNVKIIAN